MVFFWLCLSVTHSLTDCRLVNLIDVTLACKDANSKVVEVVTVADVDDEDRVGNSLLQIWKLRFGHKTKLLFRLWAQGLVNILKLGLTKILSLSLVKILMFGWDLEVNALIKILKLFDQDLCNNLWYEHNPRVRRAFGNV